MFSNTLIRQIWGDLFLKGTKIVCLVREDLKWWSRNIKWDLLTIVSMSFSNKLMIKDWNWRTPITDMFNLEENNYAYKKNYLWRKKRFEKLRYRIHTRWGKWRELKNYESTNSLYNNWEEVMRQYKGSLHKCRKCKSRWIPWMIHKNYKKWNRITAVNQQRFQVFVLCWAATNACHSTHGIRLDHRKTFLVTNALRLIRPEIVIKEFIILRHQVFQDRFQCILVQERLSQEMKIRIGAQFQCRHLQESHRPWIHFFRWIFRRILWLDSKDSRYRNFNSINSLHLLHSYVGRKDSKTKWLLVLIFHRRLCYGSKK